MSRREGTVMQRSDGLTLVVTHGGEEAARYRNVLEALEEAIASRADMFEFDVRRTADGRLVVHHDEAIGSDRLRDLTFAEAERAAGAAGYRIPTLDALLQRASGSVKLDVELKEPGYEPAILRMLSERGFGPHEFVMTSFERAALNAVHVSDPGVTTGLLVYDVSGPEALQLFSGSGASFLGPDHTIVDDEMLRQAAAASIPLVPWTVNDGAVMERLLRARSVAAIITDRPSRAIEVRRQVGEPRP